MSVVEAASERAGRSAPVIRRGRRWVSTYGAERRATAGCEVDHATAPRAGAGVSGPVTGQVGRA